MTGRGRNRRSADPRKANTNEMVQIAASLTEAEIAAAGLGDFKSVRSGQFSFTRGEGGDIALGARVFHEKFGYGEVIGQEGNKLEIEFEKAGTKRVLDSFVEPA